MNNLQFGMEVFLENGIYFNILASTSANACSGPLLQPTPQCLVNQMR
jgi:hypothetical protein